MKQKIGIITRHCYPNYGSILQAYALENAFKQLGADPEVIDYVNPSDTPLGLVAANLRISSMGRSWWKRAIYQLVQTPTFLSMGLTFRRHQKRLLTLTHSARGASQLKQVCSSFHMVVAGSDQIWNRITSEIDTNYFLPFLEDEKKRASYAASLGSTKPLDEDIAKVLSSVGQFSHVSVREPSSADWLNSHGIDARSDVDPVLLHNKEFWSTFAGRSRSKSPYILVYQLHNTKQFRHRLAEVEARYGLPVIRITPDWKHIARHGRTKILVSPESFVAWIRDAACVVTDSFHGTAFSLRLGTPLYVIPPGKYSTRLLDVVARVGLERLVVPADISTPITEPPDYDVELVHTALDAQADRSREYLRQLIETGTRN
ncbi:polysaccharide pyruvyl transferase family protein [Caulobacter sp.]|uniref:polysaccharide pyruvyl transferase family protein n=1 Tax=Caulobacter sp. TaxID=78 RepID=UPI0031E2108A